MPLNKAVKQSNDNLLTPYITIASNVTQLGTSVTPPNRGATTAYPTTAAIGDQFFDSTTNELKVFTVNGWVSAGTAPNAPTNVVATSAAVAYGGTPGATITWTPATTGVPASSYVVTSSVGGFTQTTTGNSVTIYGLTAGTSYTFTVTAKNSFGSNATTSGSLSPVTTPQTPTIGTPTITAAGLSVPLTAGATGGSAITGYTVTSNPGNISVTSASAPVLVPTILPVTGGSITAGTVYSFTATANNVAGASLPTNASSSEIDTPTFVTSGLLCNYDFYNGSYGGQNLLLQSESFNTSPWYYTYTITSANMSRTANSITDPLGGNNGWLIADTAFQGGDAALVQSISGISGTGTYFLSVYLKANPSNPLTQPTSFAAFFVGNSTTGVSGNITVGVGQSGVSGPITATYVGNGWYKYVLTATGTNALNTSLVWQMYFNSNGSYYAWGAQLQNAASSNLAPGYIKTTSSQINYTTGSTIYDLSGNGYNTTISNFGGYSNSLANGYGSLIFNATASTATSTSGTMPNMGSGFTNATFSFWANRSFDGRMLLAGTMGYTYGDNSWSGPNGEYYYTKTATINPGQWEHITYVMNSNYTYNIYRNGYLESFTGAGTYTGALAGTLNLTGVILAIGYGAGYIWGGSLGKLSFYNRALTASEALQNFNADRVRYGV